MKQFSFNVHSKNSHFKKTFLKISLLLFFMVHAGVYAQAPCNANPVTNQIVCNNSATTAINFTGTATTFNWVNNTPSIGLAASGTGNIAAFTAINATATAIIATITVTPSSGACTGTPISFSITVNPSPVVSVTPTVACGGIAGIYGVPLSASSGPVVPGSVTVSSGILNVTVPDNNANGLISPLAMAGVPANATITNVAVTLNMSHTYPGDMIFNLKAPNGQILNLYKYGTGQFTGAASGNATWGWSGAKVSQTGTTAWSTVAAAPYIYNNSTAWRADGINGAVSGVTIQNPTGFASNASLFSNLYSTAASTTGNWTLAMCDGGAGDIGTFVEWSLTIDYTTPGTVPTYTYLWSALPGLFTDPTATAAYSGTNTPVVYAAPGVSTTYTVTATNTATGCTNTATALVNSTPPAPVITPPSVNMCLGDAPVKLKVVTGFPANPAVWSPASGLFRDATAAIPYVAGTAVDSVWVRPTPAGVYTYQVTRSGIPPGTPPCTSPPRLVVVTVSAPVTIITQPVNKTVCNNSSATFTVGVTGTGPFTYQWQMSINGGATYNNIANVAPFSGTATAALTINPASLGMNGNLFRLLVNGGACPGSTSSAALLTVYSSPTVAITANPLTLTVGQTTTIRSTVAPNPAATYTWYYNALVLPGAAADTLLVSYGSPGNYQLQVTDVNGCGVGVSNIITIANSFAINLVAYPNPSTGRFGVTYYSGTNNAVQRTMHVFNNRGDKVITKNFTQTTPYQKVDVDVRANGKGIYWIELRDAYGRRLVLSRVVVQ